MFEDKQKKPHLIKDEAFAHHIDLFSNQSIKNYLKIY